MTRSRKIITASIAALTLAGTVATTATPAAAWGHRHHGGWGWGPGAAVGLGIAGLAAGAIAASAAPVYYDTCVTRQAVYDDWGRFRGYRRVRVAC
ncbi:MAG: hypothetical protein KDJ44_09860 [Rhodoblastus sp.]|nr:hypothetical protein [Rhodoblastus sp.]MCB1535008.1 hypothetical protein [Rhodoblastus sp.]MCB9997594.1 hypothetical protein [Methylobacteriaceae bacterium]MCC0002932.1 hypothetical protein [Methylobacteriaceae bacterium]MCO5086265.1 hypothetical protein [Methylobacteriaceae bacterium]